jgi:gluconokinase
VIVVTGVSGSGKSTVGAALAGRLGWDWADGDAFHPGANIAKMAAHHPLTDADRQPWLDGMARWIDTEAAAARPAVLACSALKRSYRDRLRAHHPEVRMVYLLVDRETLRHRMADRRGHMFQADMLDSQLAALEPPTPDEGVLTVRSQPTVDKTVDRIIAEEHLEEYLPESGER